MLKRCIHSLLAISVAVSLSSAVLFAQDAPEGANDALPADLSLEGLGLNDAEAAKPEPIVIDPALLALPENATVDELFEFTETLQTKLPQPRSQEDMYALVDAISKTFLEVANKILATEELTAEQKERAVQLKVVALTTRANVDEEASKELDAFVDENLKNAASTEELVKAYQLKLQVLSASEDSLDKIDALATEMLGREEEELQIFAIEVKSQSFLTNVQKSGEFDQAIVELYDGLIADEARTAKVKEKAYEMKLVVMIVASELEKEKEEAERKGEYAAQAEELFKTLMDGDFSLDLKKSVYNLRAQTLLDPNGADENAAEKIDDLVERLNKENDPELHLLAVSVKGQKLLADAQKDEAAIAALLEFADQVDAEQDKTPELTMRVLGMKITGYRLQKDTAKLLEYVDANLNNEAVDDEIKSQLKRVKLAVVAEAVAKDPAQFDQYKDFIAEVKADPQMEQAVVQIYSAKFAGTISAIADDDASLDKFNAAIEDIKAQLAEAPQAVTALFVSQEAIDKIGEKNGNENLFEETFDSIVDFCKGSDNEQLNTLAQNLEVYAMQIKQAKEQAKAAAQAAEENAQETEEKAPAKEAAPKAEEKAPAKKAPAKSAPKANAKKAPAKKAK